MSLRWLPCHDTLPIGLDIGQRHVKAAQLAGRPGRRVVTCAAVVPRRADGAITTEELADLRQTLARQGFRGQTAVVAMPDRLLMSSQLDLPPRASGAPVEQIARAELASVHKLSPDELELALWELPSSGRAREGTRAMAVAVRHADAQTLLDQFAAAGWELAAIDVHAAAMARAYAAVVDRTDQLCAILDIGWDAAQLLVLDGGLAIYERRIAGASLKPICQQLQAKLGLDFETIECLVAQAGRPLGGSDPDESVGEFEVIRTAVEEHYVAAIRQLFVSFSYISHQYPDTSVSKLWLCGGGASMGLASILYQHTGIETAVVGLEARLGTATQPILAELGPMLFKSIGLSLHGEECP
jgi:Tfp pilus assembly PilM family ATPase